MSKFLRMSALSFAIILSQSLSASSEFSSSEACARLLSALEEYQPTPLVVDPQAEEGSQEKAFLDFYSKEIYPVEQKLQRAILEYSVYNQLVDAGFYTSEEQRKEWEDAKNRGLNIYLEYQTNSEWEKIQIQWGDLAEGLKGELPDLARRNRESLRFSQFEEKYFPLLEEQRDLDDKVDKIANESPQKMVFQENSSKMGQLLADYFDGKLSFD
ncbi:MAG: hypothetical protein GW917_01490, partial [Bdellovibrionales bacterium]|nr:hypothetical protein [Bdellovibrionales bacterium]